MMSKSASHASLEDRSGPAARKMRSIWYRFSLVTPLLATNLAKGEVRFPGSVTTAPLWSRRWTSRLEAAGGGARDGGGFGRMVGGATGVAPCVSKTRLSPSQTNDTAGASVILFNYLFCFSFSGVCGWGICVIVYCLVGRLCFQVFQVFLWRNEGGGGGRLFHACTSIG